MLKMCAFLAGKQYHISYTFELCLALSIYTNRTTYNDHGIIDITSVLLDFQDLSQSMNNSFVCGNICIAYRSIIYVYLQKTYNHLESSRAVPWLGGHLKERITLGKPTQVVSIRHIFQQLHLTASLHWRVWDSLEPVGIS